jgi:uncharacterized protein (TIGR00369 family)
MPSSSRGDAALTPLAHGALNHCFGCGLENPTGLRLRFFVDPDLNVVCHFRLARRFAGPPGHAHGGIIATLLDEAMSKANRARNILAMTRHLEVQYLRPVPLAAPLTLKARHIETHGRRHVCEGAISGVDGEVLAKGKAIFVEVPPDYLRKSSPGFSPS